MGLLRKVIFEHSQQENQTSNKVHYFLFYLEKRKIWCAFSAVWPVDAGPVVPEKNVKSKHHGAHQERNCIHFFLRTDLRSKSDINLLNAELNPICYLLALLGAHHFLHVNRIRVKSLTLRLLMSYIYIYIYIWSTNS